MLYMYNSIVTVQTYKFVMDHARTNYHGLADTGLKMSLAHIIAHQTLKIKQQAT